MGAGDSIREYNNTAASNTSLGGINLSEGVMVPSDLNNALRQLMADLALLSSGTEGIDLLSLVDDDASAAIKLQAPATVTTTTTFTLPDGDGSDGQFMKTDGSGNLSFGSPATQLTAGNAIEINGGQIDHEDTSSQASVDNSGNNFIQDITLDTYGHITGITSAEAGIPIFGTTDTFAVGSVILAGYNSSSTGSSVGASITNGRITIPATAGVLKYAYWTGTSSNITLSSSGPSAGSWRSVGDVNPPDLGFQLGSRISMFQRIS